MVGMWVVMLAITLWSWWLAWRRTRYQHAGFLRLCTYAIPVGYVAVTAGWITTEVGRQPWVVYGQLRTADAVTPNLAAHDVAVSLALYVLVYCAVFGAGVYYLVKLARAGPAIVQAPEPGATKRPARPLSAAE
jgi:cytochrome d ubiquinol oxidase subunit I